MPWWLPPAGWEEEPKPGAEFFMSLWSLPRSRRYRRSFVLIAFRKEGGATRSSSSIPCNWRRKTRSHLSITIHDALPKQSLGYLILGLKEVLRSHKRLRNWECQSIQINTWDNVAMSFLYCNSKKLLNVWFCDVVTVTYLILLIINNHIRKASFFISKNKLQKTLQLNMF